jgi:ketosteroid isomerase-like protein
VKRISRLWLLPALAVVATTYPKLLAGQGQSQDEQTIWSLEEAYFAHYAKGETEALEELWHADFTGWPSESPEPVQKSSASQSVRDFLARARIVSFKLRPMAIAIRGEVAITHYFLDLLLEDLDGGIVESSVRITHAWLREDGMWKVFGGMSAQ